MNNVIHLSDEYPFWMLVTTEGVYNALNPYFRNKNFYNNDILGGHT